MIRTIHHYDTAQELGTLDWDDDRWSRYIGTSDHHTGVTTAQELESIGPVEWTDRPPPDTRVYIV